MLSFVCAVKFGDALRAVLGIAAVIFCVACSTLPSVNGPKPAFDIDKDIKDLEAHYTSATSITTYYSQPETDGRRDEFIVGRLTVYNLEYIKYIQQFSLDRAVFDSALDIAKLGVDLSTTLVGGELAKGILGGVSAFLTGSRLSVDKNFFEEKTAQALVAEMNAQRKTALVPILQGTKQHVADYPLATAIVDLDVYYAAGTLTGALQAIQADAGLKEASADKLLVQYRNFVFHPDGNSDRIFSWLFPEAMRSPDGTPVDANGKEVSADPARVKALRDWIDANHLTGLPIEALLSNGDLAVSRANAIKALSIP